MRSIRTLFAAGTVTAALILGLATPAAASLTAVPVSAAPTAVGTATTPVATTFRLPLASKSYAVTSYFGPRCIPVQYGPTVHRGVDMGAKGGAPL